MKRSSVLFGVVMLLGASASWAQTPVVYPAKGQSAEQQSKDQGECDAWAKQTTGVDPAAVAQQASAAPAAPAPQGQRVRGALRGAAAGAVIGEIADDDAGKGAAIGATAGVVAGGARQRRQAREQQAQASAAQAQASQSIDTYQRAVNACMEGRGYVIK